MITATTQTEEQVAQEAIIKAVGRTITNRNGESVHTKMTNAEAAQKFVELFGDNDHWMWFWMHKYVLDNDGALDLDGALRRIRHMFLLAIGYGLKRPKIRLIYNDYRYKLYLSRRGTLCIKAGRRKGDSNEFGVEEYIGCVYQGRFLKAKERDLTDNDNDFLEGIADDVVGFFAQCSKDMGCCCYCGRTLEDAPSKKLGYGPVCAKRWGLPWKKNLDNLEKVPSFADLYDDKVAKACDNLLETRSSEAWTRFADWLDKHGLPRVGEPRYGVTYPA